MRHFTRRVDELTRRAFIKRNASLLAGTSLLGGSGLLEACGDSTGPDFKALPPSVTIVGPVELRTNSRDDVSGTVSYNAESANAENPMYDWVVRDKVTGEVLDTQQGSNHGLIHRFTERGTHVVDVTVTGSDGTTASSRFETQFLGPKQLYDLIAVIRSKPRDTYGYLNFLDPEALGSIRQEVLHEDNNILEHESPIAYTNSGLSQAPDGKNVVLVTDGTFATGRGVEWYNKALKTMDALTSTQSGEGINPSFGANTDNMLVTLSANRRLRDAGEFEIRYQYATYYRDTDMWLRGIGGGYLADLTGHTSGPLRDFYGTHSAVHPDSGSIMYGPAPFDHESGEVRRIAVLDLAERTRRRFPDESALEAFLQSHFASVDPSDVRVGENGMAFSLDGQRMAISMYLGSLQRSIIAIASMTSGDIQLLTGDGREPSFSPDGKRIGYLNSDNHLIIAPVDGNGPVRDATVESGGQGMHDTAFAWTG